MNEKAAIAALYTVINSNKTALTTGITHSGVARQIAFLSKSTLSTPVAYYAIGLRCFDAREFSMPGVNSVTGVAWAEYDVGVQIVDVASIQPGDVNPYETVHDDFRRVRDRLVKLLRDDTGWFPSTAARPRFRIKFGDGEQDRRIEVVNENYSFSDVESNEYAMLFSLIRFTFVDHCVNNSLI